jgi:hypothetical protein
MNQLRRTFLMKAWKEFPTAGVTSKTEAHGRRLKATLSQFENKSRN